VLYAFVKAWVRTEPRPLDGQARRIVDLLLNGLATTRAGPLTRS
jgi:hypothetical protein